MVKGIALTVLKAARPAIRAIVGAIMRSVPRYNTTANDRDRLKARAGSCTCRHQYAAPTVLLLVPKHEHDCFGEVHVRVIDRGNERVVFRP
ncbi:hypothetical protein KCU62_g119, partial [Aureobasidium sp. EXF-3399]